MQHMNIFTKVIILNLIILTFYVITSTFYVIIMTFLGHVFFHIYFNIFSYMCQKLASMKETWVRMSETVR